MEITIKHFKENTPDNYSGFMVKYGDKYADGLTYDEMLGLVTAITLPNERPCLNWLKSEEQHKAFKEKYKS